MTGTEPLNEDGSPPHREAPNGGKDGPDKKLKFLSSKGWADSNSSPHHSGLGTTLSFWTRIILSNREVMYRYNHITKEYN